MEKLYKSGSNKSADFENLRLNKTPHDVTLRIGSIDIPAHKVVLKALSPYFAKMFTQQFIEKNKLVIDLERVDCGASKSIIEFAYSGELLVDVNNVQSLYAAADYFQVGNIKLFCEDFLMQQLTNLDKENVFGVLQMGELFESVSLVEGADKYISKKFVDLASVANEEFLALEKNSVVRLFARKDLAIKSELDVFEAFKAWINHDIASRGQYTYELLQTIRLAHLKVEDLCAIADFSTCSSSDECLTRIYDAIECYYDPSKRNKIDIGETPRRGYPNGKIVILGGS